jgi:pyrimidine operon attenuation protein/uracil phosphoribosyltransferase
MNSNDSAKARALTRRLQAYIEEQPPFARKILERFRVVSLDEVSSILASTFRKTLDRLSAGGRSESLGRVKFFAPSENSSAAMAARMLSLPTTTSTSQIESGDAVIMLDDAIYSGKGCKRALETLYSTEPSNRVTLIVPLATRSSIESIIRDSPGTRLAVGSTIPTIFEGCSLEDVLAMDAYVVDESRIQSYLFDVLGLDDRQACILLTHKRSDQDAAPHKLLNLWPAFPQGGACYRPVDAGAIVRAFRASSKRYHPRVHGSASENARLSAFVKGNFGRLLERGYLGVCETNLQQQQSESGCRRRTRSTTKTPYMRLLATHFI